MIQNRRSLATTALRKDALAILEAGLKAVATDVAVRRAVCCVGNTLQVGKRCYPLDHVHRLYVIAIGKAAADAAAELERILGPRITGGIVLGVKERSYKKLKMRVATHPFPSAQNRKATGEILTLLKEAGEDDLVLVVVSGGGSAMLCSPNELSCDELTRMTKALMARGATIQEMNTVRKHTSVVLGGQLAALAAPATVASLILSDVPGDDLSMVASGPTVRDKTTVADAKAILDTYDLLRVCRLPSCELIETPKDPKIFRRVYNVLIVSNRLALAAMKREAGKRGYRAKIVTHTLSGEASEVGQRLARRVKPGQALLLGGETTVTVRGQGAGGRNQELALGALTAIPDDALVLSCGSDGIDNTPAAGAIADVEVRQSAARCRRSPEAALDDNDSYAFFKVVGGQILTGPLGRNVSDLVIALRKH